MSIVNDLKRTHENLQNAINGLTTRELEARHSIGDWSVKDVLVHMAMWDGEVLKNLALWRSGSQVDWSYVKDRKAILKFNDFWINNLKHLSARKVIQMLNSIHGAIIADLSTSVGPHREKRRSIPKWLRQITVDHNKHHIKKIQAYRESVGK